MSNLASTNSSIEMNLFLNELSFIYVFTQMLVKAWRACFPHHKPIGFTLARLKLSATAKI